MQYVKQIANLILIILGSFLGVKVGKIDDPQGEQVQILGRLCGINLDGASAVKKSMATLVCERFDRLSNEQAQQILDIVESCDANP